MSIYTEHDKDKTFHKAVKGEPTAPKRKHVRKIIVDSWNYGTINIFKQIQKEPVDKNSLVCFKALTVMHKVLQEGAPRVLREGFRYCNLLKHLQQHWGGSHEQHYANLNTEYAYFLRGKVTFHHKHPLVMGNLSLDDYTQKIKNQPEVPIQVRQEMIGHLLDLQYMILRVQGAIFRFHGRDLHESKVAALVPLLVESDAVYRISVHHLHALCDRAKDESQVKAYVERFNQQYLELRVFYDGAGRISYVTNLMRVPQLPAQPPAFAITGKLVHVVPEADHTIVVTSLMVEDQERAAPVPQPAPQPAPQPVAQQPQQAMPQAQQAQPQAQQARAGWVQFGAAPQQAQQATVEQAGQPSMDQLRIYIGQLEALCRSKDDHIAYWKNLYEQAMARMQQLSQQAEQNARRADELENHLQGILQQQQIDRQNEMLRKLDNAVNAVRSALGNLNDASNKGNPSARPEEIMESNGTMNEILGKLDDAAMKRDHTALTATLKELTKLNAIQASNSKGVAALTDDKELADALLQASVRTTEAIQELLEIIRTNPNDADAIMAASAKVRECNLAVQRATEAIIKAETVQDEGTDISSSATQELLRAAAVIQEAAERLTRAKAEARERAKRKENKVQLEVSEAIFDAAVAITEASKNLVNQASHVQQENVASGRVGAGGKLYKKDIVWSQGLISASQNVASSVSELVKNANGAADGSLGEEELVAASKGVASATTQLVVASRVRSDPNSDAQKALEEASKTIGRTTRLLVAAAKATQEEEEELAEDLSKLSMTEKKIKEMEEQTRILKLEKELERARQRLALTRKQAYSS
mmetsp:Transcript_20496/g.78571  ORF Transcript_20496/g.78571 Transcript_20496/m.78571 type:complete len:818 (-) Transcript_20496:50-2503(-)